MDPVMVFMAGTVFGVGVALCTLFTLMRGAAGGDEQ
jgi:hypothetical protein